MLMKTKKKTTKKAIAHTDIIVVLDRSGSMSSLQRNTIEGFNKFLSDQQEAEGEASITLMLFDHEFITVLDNDDISKAKSLTNLTYVPRGTTALLDAIGQSVTKAEARMKAASKPVVVIITDGEENASREYSRSNIFDMITRLRTKGWEFVFLGANQDAIKVGQGYGVAVGSTMTYAGNSAGTQAVYQSLSSNLRQVRSSSKMDMSFEDKDKKAQQDAGV